MVENRYVSPDKIKALLNVLVAYKNNVIKSSITSSSVNAEPYVATDIYTKSVAKHVFPLIPNFGLACTKGEIAFDAMAVINVGYDVSGVKPIMNCNSPFEYYGISLKKHNNLNGIIDKSTIRLTSEISRNIVDVLSDRNTDKPIQSYKTVLVLTDIIDTLDYKDSEDTKIIDGIIELASLFDFTYLTFSAMYKDINRQMRCRYSPFKYKNGTRYRVISNYTGYNYSPTMYTRHINSRINDPINPVGEKHMCAHVFLNDDLVVIDRGQYNFNDCIDSDCVTHMFKYKDDKDAYIRDNNVTPIYKSDIEY